MSRQLLSFSSSLSLSKKKKNSSAPVSNTTVTPTATIDHHHNHSHQHDLSKTTPSSTKSLIASSPRKTTSPYSSSSEKFDKLSHLATTNSNLRTRNPARKRHSVMISSDLYEQTDQVYNNNGHNVYDYDFKKNNNTSITNAKSSNSVYKTVTHSRSVNSLIDFSNDFDELMETTQDSDTILNDLDNSKDNHDDNNNDNNNNNNDNDNDNTTSKDYSNTITAAFSSYNNQLNVKTTSDLATSSSIPTSLSTQTSLSSRSLTTSPRQSHHPLRKLLINSPNNKLKRNPSLNTNSTSTSNSTPNSSRKSFIQNNETIITPSPTPSPLRRLNPLEYPTSNVTKTQKLPTLHVFTPDLSNEKSHLISISNCLFFETSFAKHKDSSIQTPTTDIFDYYSNVQSPIRKTESHIQRHSNTKDHDHAYLSSLATGLVDPELFTKNASSVFAGPISLTKKHRTSLHFV